MLMDDIEKWITILISGDTESLIDGDINKSFS